MSKSNGYSPSRKVWKLKLLSTLILSTLAGTAYAGGCTSISTGNYICSGAAVAGTDVHQRLSTGVSSLTVNTDPGFGIITTTDSAFSLGGIGGLSFTDNNDSIITGATFGITAGGSGVISITTTGTVTGLTNDGMDVQGLGTDVIIQANNVFGQEDGIYATNSAANLAESLSITTTGMVSGTNGDGIYVENYGTVIGARINIQTNNVFGGYRGIEAYNNALGDLFITSSGSVNGALDSGIYAVNSVNSSDLTIQALNVSGGVYGIDAENHGDGALSITTTGLVAGLNGSGINAYNEGTDLIIHVADVSGSDGIIANQAGTGALSITATGSVMGSSNGAYGILASNSANATDLTVQANNVTGGAYGIYAQQSGNGVASITATGLVMSTIQSGLYAQNDSSAGMVI
ncbi:hypothetical protein C9426_19245, partial [Serratia sp. S1B]